MEKYLSTYFPNIVDIKYLIRNDPTLKLSGLANLANLIKVDRIGPYLTLEKNSDYLAQFQNDNNIEVPGQYCGEKEGTPTPDHHMTIDKFESPLKVRRSQTLPQRMLTIRGNTGKMFCVLVQNSSRYPKTKLFVTSETTDALALNVDWAAEARLSQILQLMNKIFRKNIQTRKRNVYIRVPNYVQLNEHTRLVSTERDFVSLDDVWEKHCARQGKDHDVPIQLYRKKTTNAPQLNDKLRLEIFKEIGDKLLPDIILEDYIYSKLCLQYDSVWSFKQHFVTQIGVGSLLTYLLSMTDRNPHKIFFSASSCHLFNHLFYLKYSSNAKLVNDEVVPFRLGKSMSRFLNPICTVGLLNGVMTASAHALAQENAIEMLKNHFYLLFRDDLISWARASNNFEIEKQVPRLVQTNTSDIIKKKITELAPLIQPDQEVSIEPINIKITELINAATNDSNLAKMDPTWCAWL